MFRKLLSPGFWFDVPAFQYFNRIDLAIFWISVVLLLTALILRIVLNSKINPLTKVLIQRWLNLSFVIGVFLLVWDAFRYEGIDYLSAHVITLLIVIWAIIWAIRILVYQFGRYQTQIEQYEKDQVKKKYL